MGTDVADAMAVVTVVTGVGVVVAVVVGVVVAVVVGVVVAVVVGVVVAVVVGVVVAVVVGVVVQPQFPDKASICVKIFESFKAHSVTVGNSENKFKDIRKVTLPTQKNSGKEKRSSINKTRREG